MKKQNNMLSDDLYIIYLRKSRADNPTETVEEVLAKHEEMLQELAMRELGGMIPEHCIFREVVSGETIEERPVMMEVLRMLENPNLKGVLVVEPQRLSRGDLEDCGRVVNTFRYSNTEIITLNMTYDLTNKMQRKFFEQELMRGNDYLEYAKEILLRGRIASVKKGNYIGNIAPFGYDKVMIDDCHSLKPNENADAVRIAFDLYVNENYTPLQIARHLDSLGVKPMNSNNWEKCSIRAMLKNPHYIGLVRFGFKKTEKVFQDGQLIKKRNMKAGEEEVIIAPGKHEAIIDEAIFQAAQDKFNSNPRAKWDAPLKNPLAGIFFCKACGRAMSQHPYKQAKDRFECRNRAKCGSKSAPIDEVLNALICSLATVQLPDLEVHLKNNSGKSVAIQKKQLQKLSAEMEELKKQENKQYEFLEKGIYTEEKFIERNKALLDEMEELKKRIFNAKKDIPKEIDYADKIVKLEKAIAALNDEEMSIETKNKLIRAIIEKIEYEYVSYEGRGKVNYKLHIFLLI